MGKGVLIGEAVYLGRLGQRLLTGGVGPLIADHHPKIRHGQNGHQGPTHVATSKEVHGAGAAEGLGVQGHIPFDQPGAAAQDLGHSLSRKVRKARYGAIFVPQPPAPAAVTIDGGDQPNLPAAVQQRQRLLHQRQQPAVCRVQILEEQLHVTPADHADVGDISGGKAVGLKLGPLLPTELLCQSGAAVLHRAAADGAGSAAVCHDQHLGTRSSGRGALAGDDAAQHSALPSGKFLVQCRKYLFHRKISPLFHWDNN